MSSTSTSISTTNGPSRLLQLPNELLIQIIDEVLGQTYLDAGAWHQYDPVYPAGYELVRQAAKTAASFPAVCKQLRNIVASRKEIVMPTLVINGYRPIVDAIRVQMHVCQTYCHNVGSPVPLPPQF